MGLIVVRPEELANGRYPLMSNLNGQGGEIIEFIMTLETSGFLETDLGINLLILFSGMQLIVVNLQ
jgi:hypothetical protein